MNEHDNNCDYLIKPAMVCRRSMDKCSKTVCHKFSAGKMTKQKMIDRQIAEMEAKNEKE